MEQASVMACSCHLSSDANEAARGQHPTHPKGSHTRERIIRADEEVPLSRGRANKEAPSFHQGLVAN